MASAQQAKEFISKIAPIVQKYAKMYGYHVASPIIAQACIESAYGTSSLGYKYHNYFGMKCGSSWKGKSVNLATKEEYTPGTLTNIKANFRVYDSMDDGIKGYFEFISTKRYENLKSAKAPKEYLELIKADGYATSSTYVNTNMSCISKWNLAKYDTLTVAQGKEIKISVVPVELPTIRQGSSGKAVAIWQILLGRQVNFGQLYFDEALDIQTRKFQKDKGLVVDGIVGINSWTAGFKEIGSGGD